MPPLLAKRHILAAAVEATVGTAETLDATDADYLVRNLEVDVEADEAEREYQGTASPNANAIGARMVTFTFEIECHGKGSAGVPDWASVFLTGCGMYDDSNTMKFATAAPAAAGNVGRTLTIAAYQDGRRIIAAGCMGNCVFVAESGRPLVARFTFMGKLSAIADVALLSPTPPTVTPPNCSNLTWSWNSQSPSVAAIEIDFQNEVYLRPDFGSGAGASNYAAACITTRRPVITFSAEAVLIATHDVWNNWLSATTGAFSLAVGTAQYNIMTLAAPAAQTIQPSSTTRDGLQADDITLLCTRSAADDDEFTIAFS